MKKESIILDGNEAASYIAYKTNEVCAIYPITPASSMGEHVDEWATKGIKNIWGDVPKVVEMQSEGGAAGAVHGALQGGVLTTTFTASQGLLLMIPNMYKIAGELNPTVFHIASRSLATHALSIFGDHSDVMAARAAGFAMLFASNVQEAMDMALIAQAATLKSRIPFLHVFDGFRTSHEISKITLIPDDIIRQMIDESDVEQHRNRALSPDNPFIRGTAQNPDVFFQNREAVNRFYYNVPEIVQQLFEKFGELTGRKYSPFEYIGHPEAERIIVIMGSGAETMQETVNYLIEKGEKVGFLKVRLYRPFDPETFVKALPKTIKKIAVLDRTKEPGGIGEPLYQDVVNAISEIEGQGGNNLNVLPRIVGGRYGLSSKEFTPAMIVAVFDELNEDIPKNHFTIGIKDDVTMLSLPFDHTLDIERNDTFRGLFFGLGSDGTVGANKNSIKIIGNATDNFIQGYFVYDSKKSNSVTVSHLRFSKQPIHSTYLIREANFVGCHQFNFLDKIDVLKNIANGGTFLLNAPYGPNEIWSHLPIHIQQQIIEKQIAFYVIDASAIARDAGLGKRINTILQTCFFAISNIMPRNESIERIKHMIRSTYQKKGEEIVSKNIDSVDQALLHINKVDYPAEISGYRVEASPRTNDAPEFVSNVLARIIAGEGDELPVSAFPADGTFPAGTAKWEKRNISDLVPVWNEDLCIQCNKCVIVCPHAAIRAKVYDRQLLDEAPTTLKWKAPAGKEFNADSEAYTLQVSTEDCTGCNLCIEICPINRKSENATMALYMFNHDELRENEQTNWDYFLKIPEIDRSRINMASVKGSQLLEPLFEFSGACAGCGETPYLKLITQLMGDRMVVANATGCSSIFGGNLPTTPWSMNREGRGPAWSNSLFEDNAEFGLGIKLAIKNKTAIAYSLLQKLKNQIGLQLVTKIQETDDTTEEGLVRKRALVDQLKERLTQLEGNEAARLNILADNLCTKSVWIVGGDGWAYDIGFGGLDHVLASGENVNILIMDTEVYSNTGGQTSKATPIGASAKFSMSGKKAPKKDLALQAINYGNVYVAQIAMGANDTQTVKAILEAEAFEGPSLIIAYSHCIAHGYDMSQGLNHQDRAVKSGYWPLFRWNPDLEKGKRFRLDSKEASIPLQDYIYSENRYKMVKNADPDRAKELLSLAEEQVKLKWDRLNTLKTL